jgi:hypothetical protein
MSSFSVVLGNGGVVGVVVGVLVSPYLKGLSVKGQKRRTLLSHWTKYEIVTYVIDQDTQTFSVPINYKTFHIDSWWK